MYHTQNSFRQVIPNKVIVLQRWGFNVIWYTEIWHSAEWYIVYDIPV